MTGNPKTSKWRSTPNKNRKRRGIQLTLSPAATEALTRLAKLGGMSRSKLVELLVLARDAPGLSLPRMIAYARTKKEGET